MRLPPGALHEPRIRQLQYETDTWKRLLGFLMDENVHLKNRLAEILKDNFNKTLLEEVDNFQGRFVKEDDLISLLRHDLAEIDTLLLREIFEDGILSREVRVKMNKLRHNMVNAERQFSRLKLEFNSYLSENM